MTSCMRCGVKLAHNYLTAMFTIIDEKRKRVIVCSKCREFFSSREGKAPGSSSGR